MEKQVYTQSLCLINEAVDLYYVQGHYQSEIAKELNISKPTVSRLLKLADQYGIVQIHVETHFQDCLKLQRELKERFPIDHIYVVPVTDGSGTPEEVKKIVAIEGARYLQRILSDKDTLGIAWGGTVHEMIRSLNPCQKKGIDVVTMQGDIYRCGEDYDLAALIRRAALTFSGEKYVIPDSGFVKDASEARDLVRKKYQMIYENCFHNISISIAGAGGWLPYNTSPMLHHRSGYLRPEEEKELIEAGTVTDFILHMLDENGNEIDSAVKKRTISIDLDVYREVPHKIVLLSGDNKAYTAKAILSGGFADVIFMDYQLARRLYLLL